MGKTFNSILRGLTNGSVANQSTADPNNGDGRKGRGWWLKSRTPEQIAGYRTKAHQALRDGLTVFMSKSTVEGFNRLLDTTVTSLIMRRLLEEIAHGKLALTAPGAKAVTTAPLYKEPITRRVLPTVLSVDQLSSGMPFSLKQAAKILNVTSNQLYFRCVTGRIHFERQKSRYYIPAAEVSRLQVIGI